jgi:hypothetical protein
MSRRVKINANKHNIKLGTGTDLPDVNLENRA